MEEKRKHPRTEINEPAYVSSGGSVMGCAVRNISVEGAAIDVEKAADAERGAKIHRAAAAKIFKENFGAVETNAQITADALVDQLAVAPSSVEGSDAEVDTT